MRRCNRTAIKREQERATKHRVENAELLTLIYFFSATAALTFAIGGVLRAANDLYSRSGSSAEIVLLPRSFSLYMAGAVVGFLVAFLTSERVHRRLLGRPPDSFSIDYTIAASPYPSWLKRTTVVCLAVASLVAILNVRKHATIGSAFIVDQLALSFVADWYPLNGVSSVEMSRFYIAGTKYSPSRISDVPGLFVKFQDGRIWSPLRAELHVPDQASLADVISSRSGRPVSYTSDIEGIPDEAGVRRRTKIVLSVVGGSLILAVALWVVRRHIKARPQTGSASRRKSGRTLAG